MLRATPINSASTGSKETGSIIPIGEWVVHTACFQLKSWLDKYDKDLTIAVNLSPRQFGHHHLVRGIHR